MYLHNYGRHLVAVAEFKYLGRFLTASDDNCPAVVDNLTKAQKRRARVSRILGQEVAYPRTSRKFYKSVVQVILLFGAKLWVVSPWTGRTLGGFHHKVDRWLAKVHMMRTGEGRWMCPPLDAAMNSVRLEELEMYVLLC